MYLDTFTITKREVIASISIIAVMLLIGFFISDKIYENQLDANEKYNKAAKIKTQEILEYGMRTNIGNAFVYGNLEAIDTVTYPEIGGKYMYVEKVEQHYTMHTRTVCSGSGKNRTCRTQTYWTWDTWGREDKKSKEIKFLGHVFKSNKIDIPDTEYIDTIKTSSTVRYKYYGVNTKYKGTIFTKLENNTMSKSSFFYKNMEIDETVERLTSDSNIGIIIFWIIWIVLIGLCVYGFYYIDNDWLE